MQTPEKADDPLAPILTRILELALTCAPRSEQQAELVKAYAHTCYSGTYQAVNQVKPDQIRALIADARSLLTTVSDEEFPKISELVRNLNNAAASADRRDTRPTTVAGYDPATSEITVIEVAG